MKPSVSRASPSKSLSMPGHDPQQRALARAVAAQHADLGAGIERQPDILEHFALADLLGQSRTFDRCIVATCVSQDTGTRVAVDQPWWRSSYQSGRDAEHDIEMCRELAGFGICERREVDSHRIAGRHVADAAVDAVALVLRMRP